ncbi:MAG: dihydroorotate dehydrogenase electron transfer subunit [Elusimicrobia bacterium]|nr:dihydroorotate dehydrogenase electron transfer subunit [Elusimicrobiota bacterium]
MYQTNTKLISNKKLSGDFFLLTFTNPKISRNSKPGQFIMLKIDDEKTFLRRPFSICRTSNNTFDILFKVVGKGTEILSKAKRGDIFNILGPLGNGYTPLPTSHLPAKGLVEGFPLARQRFSGGLPVLVGGGTGVASLLFLAQSFALKNIKPVVFIGAKIKKDVMFENQFKKYGCKVIVSTEDGSYGKRGMISKFFSSYLIANPYSLSTVIYSCGPKPMLKEIAKISKKYNLKCFVSLEEKMACGIGTCMGCVVKIRRPMSNVQCPMSKVQNQEFEYKSVCKDGPVFDAEDIIW